MIRRSSIGLLALTLTGAALAMSVSASAETAEASFPTAEDPVLTAEVSSLTEEVSAPTEEVSAPTAEATETEDGSAEETRQTVAHVELTFDEPVSGGIPDLTAEYPSGAGYEVSLVSWTCGDQPADIFSAGSQYTVSAVVSASEGFEFSDSTSAEINGSGALISELTADYITVTFSFDIPEEDKWSFVDEALQDEQPVIAVPDGTVVPAEVMEKIRNSGKQVELQFSGYSWIISRFYNGYVPQTEDLSFTVVDEEDWAEAVKNAEGHVSRMQIEVPEISGFRAYLQLDLSSSVTGSGTYFANLYSISGDSLVWKFGGVIVDLNGQKLARLYIHKDQSLLVTVDSVMNPGVSVPSSGSSSGGAKPEYMGVRPARTSKSEGWTNIEKEISSASAGEVIEVTLNDETTMPESALQAAIDNKIKLLLDADFGREWTINGADAVPGKYIDLSISGVNVDIPEEAYAGISFEDSRKLDISARQLGFTAQLRAFVGEKNIGQNAAVYLYDEASGRLVFQTASIVDSSGDIIFELDRGGKYFIALGSELDIPTAYICGDVNGDGVVNALDASAILKYVQHGGIVDRRSADTNSDGRIDDSDAMAILRYAVGEVDRLPVLD